jgi:hypothetical protein
MLSYREVPRVDISHLDRFFFDSEGKFQARSAKDVRLFDNDELRTWCHLRSRYNIPTSEQVDTLKNTIGNRSALEIGAGMGDLGALLGIRMTDSYNQTLPEVKAYYDLLGQPTISPPSSVEKIDAVEAIKKYKPQVVIAAWVTQLFQEGDTEARIGSSVYGVDEGWLLDHCEAYVFVGNHNVHKYKRINTRRHATYDSWNLVSRALDPKKNFIAVWGK